MKNCVSHGLTLSFYVAVTSTTYFVKITTAFLTVAGTICTNGFVNYLINGETDLTMLVTNRAKMHFRSAVHERIKLKNKDYLPTFPPAPV